MGPDRPVQHSVQVAVGCFNTRPLRILLLFAESEQAVKMNLYWLTYDTPRGIEVRIGEGGHLLMARIKAALAGQQGGFREGHQLDAQTAKKIPAKMIGRPLSHKEAFRLLNQL